MPIRDSEKDRYPADWPEVSRRIRLERAGGKCEWPGCEAPNGELIFRLRRDPEQWRSPGSGDLDEIDPEYRGVIVVLTVAHLDADGDVCQCRATTGRKCAIDEHLKAWCQLHHLRYDSKHHVRNAARTRRKNLKNLELFSLA